MSVGTQQWYDKVMVEEGSPAMEPLETSPWRDVYDELAKLIQPHEPIVDLGCGTGRFIELLCRNEHYAQLVGVDWSDTALDAAQRYAKPTHPDAPPIIWAKNDLSRGLDEGEIPKWIDPLRAGGTVYVCSEVLEHLENDQHLVAAIPPGHRFLFTVPNFESESHVRVFRHVSSAWVRYEGLLTFSRWCMVGSERQGIHIYEARRREDTWVLPT